MRRRAEGFDPLSENAPRLSPATERGFTREAAPINKVKQRHRGEYLSDAPYLTHLIIRALQIAETKGGRRGHDHQNHTPGRCNL